MNTTTTINVSDVLNVLEHNNIPHEKQIEILEVLNLALYAKNYPKNTCGIIDHKIQLLQQLQSTQPNTQTEVINTACIKVRSVAILELLNTLNIHTASTDRTKISKLIAFLTGSTNNRIYNEIKKGICFTKYHRKDIDEINKIFVELGISVSIDKSKNY